MNPPVESYDVEGDCAKDATVISGSAKLDFLFESDSGP
jgi:hypothetical protein